MRLAADRTLAGWGDDVKRTLIWHGLEFTCEYTPGTRGDRENPPEEPELKILDVTLNDLDAVRDWIESDLHDAAVETLAEPEEPDEHNNDPD